MGDLLATEFHDEGVILPPRPSVPKIRRERAAYELLPTLEHNALVQEQEQEPEPEQEQEDKEEKEQGMRTEGLQVREKRYATPLVE